MQSFGNVFRGPKDEELEALLNEWGEQGWEITNLFRHHGADRITVVARRLLSAPARRRRTFPG